MIATALGSFSGTGMAATVRAVLDLLPDRAPLPELPDRGPHAGILARALCLLTDLPFDLQPAGLRFAPGPSIIARRARRTLLDDVDVLAENLQDWSGAVTLTLAGPSTLAACVDLPRGGKSIGDPGARRDIAQAWQNAAADQVGRLAGVLGRRIGVQIDEPCLGQVLRGRVPDESGRGTLPPVAAEELTRTLAGAVTAARGGGADGVVVHCCDSPVPLDLLLDSGADAPSMDIDALADADWERLAEWAGRGRPIWLGLVPTGHVRVGKAFIARRLDEACSRLGLAPDAATGLVLTPACGLAGVDRTLAWHILGELAGAARG